MHKRLRLELPGKVLPPLPRKNKQHSLYGGHDDDSDADSISSGSTEASHKPTTESPVPSSGGLRSYLPFGGGSHKRSQSRTSDKGSPRASMEATHQRPVSKGSPWLGSPSLTPSGTGTPRSSSIGGQDRSQHVLHREEQRVSLRAFLRNFLRNEVIAQSKAMAEFLTVEPIHLNEEEMVDIRLRMEMDEKRIEEQKQFYEIAQQRARELDVHMEKFRRSIVESSESDCD